MQALKSTHLPDSSWWYLLYEQDGSVATIRLNYPQKVNAYNREMLDEFESLLDRVEVQQDIRVLVLDSTSENFCAGADLDEIDQHTTREILSLKSRRLFDRLSSLPLVSIAKVNGCAVAGGFELALACDFIVASDRARFWFTEVENGLIPAANGISRLLERTSVMLTRELVILGRRISAKEALAGGVINDLVSEAELDEKVCRLAETISDLPEAAVQIAKLTIRDLAAQSARSFELVGQACLNEIRKQS